MFDIPFEAGNLAAGTDSAAAHIAMVDSAESVPAEMDHILHRGSSTGCWLLAEELSNSQEAELYSPHWS